VGVACCARTVFTSESENSMYDGWVITSLPNPLYAMSNVHVPEVEVP